MQVILIWFILIINTFTFSKDIIDSLNKNKVQIDDKVNKKDVAWISSMYSTHRNWLNKRNNPFKPLNEVIKLNK